MIAVDPALAISSTPSGNGKNASDAATVPLSGSCAFIAPILHESTRLICPAPTPTVWPSRTYKIAFDFTCLQTSSRIAAPASLPEWERVWSLFSGRPPSEAVHRHLVEA